MCSRIPAPGKPRAAHARETWQAQHLGESGRARSRSGRALFTLQRVELGTYYARERLICSDKTGRIGANRLAVGERINCRVRAVGDELVADESARRSRGSALVALQPCNILFA